MSNTDELRAAAQQALVALVHHTEQTRPIQRTADAIAALRAALAQQPAASGEPVADLREKLTDAIAAGLHGTYHCTRVWDAWHVGTMSEDDFEPVDESDTPAEIADAVLALMPAAAQPAPALVPLEEDRLYLMADKAETPAWGEWYSDYDALLRFARAIEAAHGIAAPDAPQSHPQR